MTPDPLAPVSIDITNAVTGPLPPDGVTPGWPNILHTRIEDVVKKNGEPPWAEQIVRDERNVVTLIANPPGTGNRPHWHSNFDEWWVVMAGVLEWHYTGGQVVRATEGDIAWVPRGSVHHIQNVGEEMSLRLAMAMNPAPHYYHRCDGCGFHQDGPDVWG